MTTELDGKTADRFAQIAPISRLSHRSTSASAFHRAAIGRPRAFTETSRDRNSSDIKRR
ncbi:MAG: hypothetical protein K0M49_04540 [Arenimonas sp.]|nr:hypothetical protein [Rhizobium sp.]MBW8444879.1 hypothetical protein [Arenimonas sp.]